MNEIAWDIIKILGGALGSGMLLYFTISQKVSHMSGQLDILVEMVKLSEKNREELGKAKSLMLKQRQDLNGFYDRLRKVEANIAEPPTSHHGA